MNAVPLISHDARTLRQVFACFPTGVTAICCMHEGEPVGMAASSFTSVSLEPALVSICVQTTSSTWPKLRKATRIGISMLSEDQDHACRSLSAKEGDRFQGVAWTARDNGAVLIDGSAATMECAIYHCVDAGDHQIILLQIHGFQIRPSVEPLVFHGSRFRRLAPHSQAA